MEPLMSTAAEVFVACAAAAMAVAAAFVRLVDRR